jgi:DNA-binding NtrC family response regulator
LGRGLDGFTHLDANDGVHPSKQWEVFMAMSLDETIREAVIEALSEHHGNRTHASRALDISIRTMRNYIQKFDLADRFKSSEMRLRDGSLRLIEDVYERLGNE